jgi:hypothetical protein
MANTRTRNGLDRIAWGEKYFGSLLTGRAFPRRRMLGYVRRGLAKSVGQVLVCDGDGCPLDPEREREGFVLTEQGRAILSGGADER